MKGMGKRFDWVKGRNGERARMSKGRNKESLRSRKEKGLGKVKNE